LGDQGIDAIKMELREIGYEEVEWIQLAQKSLVGDLKNTVMGFLVP
jgi:hypothetical protein